MNPLTCFFPGISHLHRDVQRGLVVTEITLVFPKPNNTLARSTGISLSYLTQYGETLGQETYFNRNSHRNRVRLVEKQNTRIFQRIPPPLLKMEGGEGGPVFGSWRFIICLECLLPAITQILMVRGSPHGAGCDATLLVAP